MRGHRPCVPRKAACHEAWTPPRPPRKPHQGQRDPRDGRRGRPVGHGPPGPEALGVDFASSARRSRRPPTDTPSPILPQGRLRLARLEDHGPRKPSCPNAGAIRAISVGVRPVCAASPRRVVTTRPTSAAISRASPVSESKYSAGLVAHGGDAERSSQSTAARNARGLTSPGTGLGSSAGDRRQPSGPA